MSIEKIVEKIINQKSNNTIEVAEAQIALQNAIMIRDREKKAYFDDGGYSWGYWGEEFESKVDEAEKRLKIATVSDTIKTIKCILQDPEMVEAIKNLD